MPPLRLTRLLRLPDLGEKFARSRQEVQDLFAQFDARSTERDAYVEYLKQRLDQLAASNDIKAARREAKDMKAKLSDLLRSGSARPGPKDIERELQSCESQGGQLDAGLLEVDAAANAIQDIIRREPAFDDANVEGQTRRAMELRAHVEALYLDKQVTRQQVSGFLRTSDLRKRLLALNASVAKLSGQDASQAAEFSKRIQACFDRLRPENPEAYFDGQLSEIQALLAEKVGGGVPTHETKGLNEVFRDKVHLRDKSLKAPKAKRIATWETSSYSADFANHLVSDPLSSRNLDAAIEALKGKATTLIKSLDANSDVLFDLSLKSAREWTQYFAASLGLALDDETQFKMADELGKAMTDVVASANPNKARGNVQAKTRTGAEVSVPERVTIQGTEYENPQYLAQGAFGAVLKYSTKDNASSVVVKTLLNQENRAAMVDELKLHRQVLGGEIGTPDENQHIVQMHGVVLGEQGEVYMVMETADGGTAETLADVIQQAKQAGWLTQELVNALNADFLAQAVQGLKRLQEQNCFHHDIKADNFLLSGDGTLKMADFGAGRAANEQGQTTIDDYRRGDAKDEDRILEVQGAKATMAPELINLKSDESAVITGKADTYALGCMLDTFTTPVKDERDSKQVLTGADFRSAQSTTALDRIKNAMIHEDPRQRPSIAAVESCMFFESHDVAPQQLADVKRALMNLSKNCGGRMLKLRRESDQAQRDATRLKAELDAALVPGAFSYLPGESIKNVRSDLATAKQRFEALANSPLTDLYEPVKQLGKPLNFFVTVGDKCPQADPQQVLELQEINAAIGELRGLFQTILGRFSSAAKDAANNLSNFLASDAVQTAAAQLEAAAGKGPSGKASVEVVARKLGIPAKQLVGFRNLYAEQRQLIEMIDGLKMEDVAFKNREMYDQAGPILDTGDAEWPPDKAARRLQELMLRLQLEVGNVVFDTKKTIGRRSVQVRIELDQRNLGEDVRDRLRKQVDRASKLADVKSFTAALGLLNQVDAALR